ncbi:MAG: class II fructose-1,6-bisphosphate aldolase [Bacilli bacterium]|jgi:fructose-bisphosphate aldolase class II|nr:class II fructose-1,6-bisphosphate aldolase [Bacilli bacterium]
MPLVNMKGMLQKAWKEHYAVGQFNINNLEWMQAILDEAQTLEAPVILGVSQGAAKYMGGWDVVVAMVKAYIKDQGISVPVAIHLDHAASFEVCKAAIDAGFTSVMIDASRKPFAENVAETKKVVDYAKPFDVSVETELGRVGGKEEEVVAENMYAVPEECLTMVKDTHIDALAPALGSVHGVYHGEPKLGFERMEEINEACQIPLVLHGGSGIPDWQLKKAIERGTAKINVNTENQQAWEKIVREIIASTDHVWDMRKIIGPGKKGIQEVVAHKCEVFGCIGKAK